MKVFEDYWACISCKGYFQSWNVLWEHFKYGKIPSFYFWFITNVCSKDFYQSQNPVSECFFAYKQFFTEIIKRTKHISKYGKVFILKVFCGYCVYKSLFLDYPFFFFETI